MCLVSFRLWSITSPPLVSRSCMTSRRSIWGLCRSIYGFFTYLSQPVRYLSMQGSNEETPLKSVLSQTLKLHFWHSRLPSSYHQLPFSFHQCQSHEYLVMTLEANHNQLSFYSLLLFIVFKNRITRPMSKLHPGGRSDFMQRFLLLDECLPWLSNSICPGF